MTSKNPVYLKRIYEDVSPDDGARILVDRLWPRGVSKERAALTLWDKEVAPSSELREWYGHDPAKFEEFAKKYQAELAEPPASDGYQLLEEHHVDGPVTLLTASKAVDISEAAVLQKMLQG